MKHTESWLKGLFKKETEVFISKCFDHVEIVETFVLFGFWTIKEEYREVFLPDVKITEQGKLRVICEVYLELHEIVRRLQHNDSF